MLPETVLVFYKFTFMRKKFHKGSSNLKGNREAGLVLPICSVIIVDVSSHSFNIYIYIDVKLNMAHGFWRVKLKQIMIHGNVWE